jgi:hypothetical protein
MKKLGNQNIYFDFIYGRTSILGRDKVSNKKSMYFDAITSIINLQKRGHLYIWTGTNLICIANQGSRR